MGNMFLVNNPAWNQETTCLPKKLIKPEKFMAGNTAFIASPIELPNDWFDNDCERTRKFIQCDQILPVLPAHMLKQVLDEEEKQWIAQRKARRLSLLLDGRTHSTHLGFTADNFVSSCGEGNLQYPKTTPVKTGEQNRWKQGPFRSTPAFTVKRDDWQQWTYDERPEDICLAGRCTCTELSLIHI